MTPPLAVNSAAAYRAWDDLGGYFVEGFKLAMDISVYSLVSVSRHAAELMPDGGSSLFVPARAGFTRAAEMALLGEKVVVRRVALRHRLDECVAGS